LSIDQVIKQNRAISVSIRIIPRGILPEYICPIPAKKDDNTTENQGSFG
jgi:hypothetical protein